MARPATLNYEVIAAAAQHVSTRGEKVSIRNVRADIGYGSLGTIAEFLSRWKKENSTADGVRKTLSSKLQHAVEVEITARVTEAVANIIAQESNSDDYNTLLQTLANTERDLSETQTQLVTANQRITELNAILKIREDDIAMSKKSADQSMQHLSVLLKQITAQNTLPNQLPNHDKIKISNPTLIKPIRTRFTQEQKDEVQALLQAGLSVKDIAQQTGINSKTIYRFRQDIKNTINDSINK